MTAKHRGLSPAARKEVIEFASAAATRAARKETKLTRGELQGMCNRARAAADKRKKQWENSPSDEKMDAWGRYLDAAVYADLACELAAQEA